MSEERIITELLKDIEETMEEAKAETNNKMKELLLGKAHRRALDLESNIGHLLYQAEKKNKEEKYAE